MSITAWIAFTLAYGLMAVTPGPTTLLVVSYGLSHGRRTALAVVGGTGLGDATCLTAALFGIGALLAASATAFSILKIAGALYLVFLGVRIWRAPPLLHNEATSAPRSLRRAFIHAWLTTVFNPKSVLFFMIFVPQFMDPKAPLGPQFAIMVATVLVSGAIVDGSYSLFASHLRRFIRTRRAQRIIN
ncbi:MAG: LysE family translocator, partial [Acetobacteraceae bacterium]